MKKHNNDIEYFELLDIRPNRDENEMWWVFYQKCNPTIVKLVFLEGGEYRGDFDFVRYIRNITEDRYIIEEMDTLEFLREYEVTVQRSQSGLKMEI